MCKHVEVCESGFSKTCVARERDDMESCSGEPVTVDTTVGAKNREGNRTHHLCEIGAQARAQRFGPPRGDAAADGSRGLGRRGVLARALARGIAARLAPWQRPTDSVFAKLLKFERITEWSALDFVLSLSRERERERESCWRGRARAVASLPWKNSRERERERDDDDGVLQIMEVSCGHFPR